MTAYVVQWLSQLPLITSILFWIYILIAVIKTIIPFVNLNFLYFGKTFYSISFVYELILFTSYSKALENHHYLRINYLICLLTGSSLIFIVSHLKIFRIRYLSRSFIFYLVCLFNNYTYPNGRTIFLPGIIIKNKYMTGIWIFVSHVFRVFEWSEFFLGILVAYLFNQLKRLYIFRNRI